MAQPKPEKVDLQQVHKQEYRKPRSPILVDVGPAHYLVARGAGGPGGATFQKRIEALYGMVYTVKFTLKEAGRDFVVGKLEALYGVDGQGAEELGALPKEEWRWRMMIRVPTFVDDSDLAAAREALRGRGKQGDFDAVQLETIEEGSCVQVLHVGPYEEEGETLAKMDAFCEEEGLTATGWHHEIYFSDPRRVPPERLKTLLRRPVSEGG